MVSGGLTLQHTIGRNHLQSAGFPDHEQRVLATTSLRSHHTPTTFLILAPSQRRVSSSAISLGRTALFFPFRASQGDSQALVFALQNR